MPTPTDAELDEWAAALRGSDRYRVLTRFVPPRSYAAPDGSPTRTALAVDVETTGLDPAADAIIQLCAIPFAYCPTTGRIFEVGAALTYLEDPGRPIPTEIVELTGITDEAVAGKRIDEERVAAAASAASLVIAHNAFFDRRFLERRLPCFADKPWACSQQEISWAPLGSAKLEYLMIKRCSLYFAAHSAEQDCSALIHMLATPLDSGELPMRILLESARRASVRIYAVDSPFEKKDLLKARRYRWDPGGVGRLRCWYIDVAEDRYEAEYEWLKENIYGGNAQPIRRNRSDARLRYSDRVMDALLERR